MAAAVALKVFDIFERRNIIGHVQAILPAWAIGLASLEDHPLVSATRVFGLAGAVQVAMPGETASSAASPSLTPGGLSKQLYEAGLEAGIVVRPLQGSAVLAPPLIITEAEIGELFRRLRVALDATLANLPR